METQGRDYISNRNNEFCYDLNHPDIEAAKKIEQYYELFDVFTIKDKEVITLILASSLTIIKSFGIFSKDELYNILSYMSEYNRKKVVDHLCRKEWIKFNGIDFEMPDRVKSFVKFLFTSLIRGEMSEADSFSLINAESEIIEYYNLSDEEKDMAYHIAIIGELRKFQDKMERILQKRNQREIVEIIKQSAKIKNNIQDLKKLLRKRESSIFSRFEKRHEAHYAMSGIIDVISRILQVGVSDILSNTKSAMADYISLEMIDDFLASANLEIMAEMILNKFASPKIVNQLWEETVITKTEAFINSQPNYMIATPPPPQVEFVEEVTVIEKVDDPMDVFYQELLFNMVDKREAPIEQVVFKSSDSFGTAMYKTGQMIKLSSNTNKYTDKSDIFQLDIKDNVKDLTEGPVEKITETIIKRREI